MTTGAHGLPHRKVAQQLHGGSAGTLTHPPTQHSVASPALLPPIWPASSAPCARPRRLRQMACKPPQPPHRTSSPSTTGALRVSRMAVKRQQLNATPDGCGGGDCLSGPLTPTHCRPGATLPQVRHHSTPENRPDNSGFIQHSAGVARHRRRHVRGRAQCLWPSASGAVAAARRLDQVMNPWPVRQRHDRCVRGMQRRRSRGSRTCGASTTCSCFPRASRTGASPEAHVRPAGPGQIGRNRVHGLSPGGGMPHIPCGGFGGSGGVMEPQPDSLGWC